MINLHTIPEIETSNPADDSAIDQVQALMNKELPKSFVELLKQTNGFYSDLVVIYSTDTIIERNQTFEVETYCPGYINIGDNSGGQAILLNCADHQDFSVYIAGHGAMMPEYFEILAESFHDWLESGCPLDED